MYLHSSLADLPFKSCFLSIPSKPQEHDSHEKLHDHHRDASWDCDMQQQQKNSPVIYSKWWVDLHLGSDFLAMSVSKTWSTVLHFCEVQSRFCWTVQDPTCRTTSNQVISTIITQSTQMIMIVDAVLAVLHVLHLLVTVCSWHSWSVLCSICSKTKEPELLCMIERAQICMLD